MALISRAVCIHLAPSCAHLEESAADEIRSETNGKWALRDKQFQEQIEAALGLRAIRGTAGRSPKALREADER